MQKRVVLESKEAVHVMALFENKIVLGGGEGSIYILDRFGNVVDVRSKAHPSTVTALLAVGTQLWSGSDDGMMHTWEMKVSLASFYSVYPYRNDVQLLVEAFLNVDSPSDHRSEASQKSRELPRRISRKRKARLPKLARSRTCDGMC